MKDRRECVRASGLINVKYKIPKLQIEGQSLAKNVSRKGIRMAIDRKLDSAALSKSATMIELEIDLPTHSKPIFATGEVKWSLEVEKQGEKYFDTGIEFVQIEGNDRDRIGRHVYDHFK